MVSVDDKRQEIKNVHLYQYKLAMARVKKGTPQ